MCVALIQADVTVLAKNIGGLREMGLGFGLQRLPIFS